VRRIGSIYLKYTLQVLDYSLYRYRIRSTRDIERLLLNVMVPLVVTHKQDSIEP
jgi:hypothetical protein